MVFIKKIMRKKFSIKKNESQENARVIRYKKAGHKCIFQESKENERWMKRTTAIATEIFYSISTLIAEKFNDINTYAIKMKHRPSIWFLIMKYFLHTQKVTDGKVMQLYLNMRRCTASRPLSFQVQGWRRRNKKHDQLQKNIAINGVCFFEFSVCAITA